MRAPARILPLVAAAILLGSVLTGCSGGDEAAPEWQPTGLSAFDAASVQVQRAAFCDRIPGEAVTASVGEVKSTGHYGNGEAAELSGRTRDVSHEFNCSFVGTDGRVARAWLFVPQVTPARAKALVSQLGSARKGCTTLPGEGFGSPSTSTVCRIGETAVATYHGLFVDAWLSCSLSVPDPAIKDAELRESAGEWCVEAARATAPSPG